MSLGHTTWKGRKKRPSRRVAHDLRTLLPLIGVALCFALSSTAIFAAQWIPLSTKAVSALASEGHDASARDLDSLIESIEGPPRFRAADSPRFAGKFESLPTERSRVAQPRR